MTIEKTVRITVELTDTEAWEYAQFLKRVGRDDYKGLCEHYNTEGPYHMVAAGEKIREALVKAGYEPR